MKINGKFGTITICMPDIPPTKDDEERLYNVLVECLLIKPKRENTPDIQKSKKAKDEICV